MQQRNARVEGAEMRRLERGSGVPVVFVHGIPTSAELWRHVLPLVPSGPRELLERAGLVERVEAIFTVDEVEAYKPHPEPHRQAVDGLGLTRQDVTLVAAHAWDVIGAQAANLQAIWIDRLERRWPFPLPEPRRAGNLEQAAELVVGVRR
jgi:hypothetical protein